MHMPLLLGTDGKKLSKRRNPTSIFYYRDTGYLPEAFSNFMTLMGYSMLDGREMYPLEDIIKEFDPKRIGVSGAVFDVLKLDWLNQQYIIQNIPQDKLWERIREWNFTDSFMKKLIPLIHSRMKHFSDFIALSDFLFINNLPYTESLFAIPGYTNMQVAAILQAIIWEMELSENWSSSGINEASRKVSEAFGANHKKVIMPLLFSSIMGRRHGLPLFDSVELLGKDRTRVRLMRSIEFVGGLSTKKLAELKHAWEQNDARKVFDTLI